MKDRTKYLRTERRYYKLWDEYKNCTPKIEKILKNGIKSDDDNHLVMSILNYILGKLSLEEWDKELLEDGE